MSVSEKDTVKQEYCHCDKKLARPPTAQT